MVVRDAATVDIESEDKARIIRMESVVQELFSRLRERARRRRVG